MDDLPLFIWPPRSPKLTPYDFYIEDYIKDLIYKPPLWKILNELEEHFTAALRTVDSVKLQNVWNELDYRLDVPRVRKVHTQTFVTENKQT